MIPKDLERDFATFVDRHGLVPPGTRVVAAVSGGIDSMVLLALLDGLRGSTRFDLSVAHVNHRLRAAESDEDEAFVRQAASRLGVGCHVHRSSVLAPSDGPHSGVQERAREERYRFFSELAAAPGTRIATAHHRDDNAETILFNFLRGSGVHGLSGIPLVRADVPVIRPLLFATRGVIAAYAAAAGLSWREDASNATTNYTRNVLRHTIIPSIEAGVNPGFREAMARTALLFTDLEAFVAAEVDRVLPGVLLPGEGTRLDVGALAALPPFLRESVLHAVARRFSPFGVGFVHVRTLLRLLETRPGSSCLLLKELHASRERDCLVLRKAPPSGEPFDFPVEPGESYAFERFSFTSGTPESVAPGGSRLEEFIDADRLRGPLRLRNWEEGDWFIPLGMNGRKKLSDYFIDRKIPLTEKHRVPILVSGDDIVWICGERLDDRFRMTPSTRNVLRLRYSPAGS